MKLSRRIKIASDIIRGKKINSERIITEGLQANLGVGTVGIFGGLKNDSKRDESFEQVTVKDLEEEYLDTLLPKIVKSNPAIDQAADFFTTLVSQSHKVTAETSQGERAIEEINEILKENKTSLSLSVIHCASSLIIRGDICAETEFDENAAPKNLWINDPIWVDWRYLSDALGVRWALGQYARGVWEEIISPNVYYLSSNPLIGERTSRSPLQTALFPAIAQSSMLKSLQSILDVHAWAQTLFSVKKLELIKLQSDGGEIEDINEEIQEAMNNISTKLASKKPDQVMGMTDDIEMVETSGGGEKYSFTRDIGELYDKHTSMGSKLPGNVGGQSERADYSTRHQGLFYSAYLQSRQENITEVIEWAYRRFMRSMGVTDDPIYTSKSVNVEARVIEAEAFQQIMEGIKLAVDAGMPLPLAIEFFEEEAGQTFSANLKSSLTEHYEMNPSQPEMMDSDRELQDTSFIAEAGSRFIQKKIEQRLNKRLKK